MKQATEKSKLLVHSMQKLGVVKGHALKFYVYSWQREKKDQGERLKQFVYSSAIQHFITLQLTFQFKSCLLSLAQLKYKAPSKNKNQILEQ